MPALPDRPRRPVDHLVAGLITVHLLMIAVQAAPSPPRMDEAALALPEVREEMDRFLGPAVSAFPALGPQEALEERVIGAVRRYDAVHDRAYALSRRWLRPVGGLQSWNMFGGTPPRSPRVLRIDVRPVGSADWVGWLDGTAWGTGPEIGFDHRHRKVQNKLSIRGFRSAREHYARWWAARWNEAFPDQPAAAVRLAYVQCKTLPAARVRAGAVPPEPTVVLSYEWEAP